MTTAEALAKARETLGKMTPGDWDADLTDPCDIVLWGPEGDFVANIGANTRRYRVAYDCEEPDAVGIAAHKNTQAAALDVIEAAQGLRAEAAGMLGLIRYAKLRAEIGNTNFAALKRRVEAVETALAAWAKAWEGTGDGK